MSATESHLSIATPKAACSFRDQPIAVWATAFACVVGFMSIGLVDPILTAIAAGLHASASQVSLLFTSYFFVTSIMMLITGFVSSRLGSRVTLLIGAALIIVFAALAGTSQSVAELIGFRAGWGLGNAFFVVTALSVLVAVTRGGTGKAVLIYEAAIGLGLSGGPLVGALLGAQSWRYPFFGTATLMGIGFVSILLFLPKLPKPDKKIAISAPIRALGHPGLFTVSLASFFYFFAFFTVLAFAPFVLDLSAYAVGGIFFGWGVLLAIFSVFVAPRVDARFGILPVISVCLVLLAAMLIAMGLGSKLVVAVCVILSGAVMGVCNTLFTELALEVSDVPRPVASAGYNFLRWFAGVIAPFAVPHLAEAFGVLPAFSVAAVAALLAPVIMGLRRASIAPAEHEACPAADVQQASVIIAVDGSDRDGRVIEQAIALARSSAISTVTALHVRMREVVEGEEAALESAERARRILANASSKLAAGGLEVNELLLDAPAGQAARRAVDHARAAGARHLVLGAPHAHEIEDLLHGSFALTAEALVHTVKDGPSVFFAY
nr:MFS transporter [uncultured Cohaesibacter sp.]